ncbi:MAG TPA: hypothetical protein VGL35_00870 [Rhizomicrobium sp.]|jgi:hypothetical protein
MPASLPSFLRVPFAALVATLSACSHGPTGSSPSHQAGRVSSIEQASADDCAIIVAIGKSELKWGKRAPSAAFLRDFELPGGGTYREECSWKYLGMAPPAIGDSRSSMAFFITRPVYSGKRAKAWFQYSVASLRRADGTLLPPFVERELCALEKRAEQWYLLGCKLTAIT